MTSPLSSRLIQGLLAFVVLAFLTVSSAPVLAQNHGSQGAEAEIRATDAVIEAARSAVRGERGSEARKLLRTAADHQKKARRLLESGRRGPAVDETLLARRLANRAMEQGGHRKSSRGNDDVEQLLGRSDQRIASAAEWLRGRSDPGGGLAADLATARRAMSRARDAYQAGQREEALKHLATVRQILSAFPMAPGYESGEPRRLNRQMEATDRLIEAMERALPRDAADRLDGAREAQRRARERLAGGQSSAAFRLAAEARAHAVRIWDESGRPADRGVTEILMDGNEASIDDLETSLGRRSSSSASRLLDQARDAHREARGSLGENEVAAAWNSARATLRLLWDARLSLAGDGSSRRKR